jgi:hypothetical protein
LRRGSQLANTWRDITGYHEMIVQEFCLAGSPTGSM